MPMTLTFLMCIRHVIKQHSVSFTSMMVICLKQSKLCVPSCSMCELLVCEAHGGGLMGHFGVQKTLDILHEHLFWPKMKRDVNRICGRCITCRKTKSKVLPHELYTPLLVPSEPWVDISMDFILEAT